MYRETGNVHSVTVCTVHVSETVHYIQCVRVYSSYCVVSSMASKRVYSSLECRNSLVRRVRLLINFKE